MNDESGGIKFSPEQLELIVETLNIVKEVCQLASQGDSEAQKDRLKASILAVSAITSGLMSAMNPEQALELAEKTNLMEGLDETATEMLGNLKDAINSKSIVADIEPLDDGAITSWMRGEL